MSAVLTVDWCNDDGSAVHGSLDVPLLRFSAGNVPTSVAASTLLALSEPLGYSGFADSEWPCLSPLWVGRSSSVCVLVNEEFVGLVVWGLIHLSASVWGFEISLTPLLLSVLCSCFLWCLCCLWSLWDLCFRSSECFLCFFSLWGLRSFTFSLPVPFTIEEDFDISPFLLGLISSGTCPFPLTCLDTFALFTANGWLALASTFVLLCSVSPLVLLWLDLDSSPTPGLSKAPPGSCFVVSQTIRSTMMIIELQFESTQCFYICM